MLETVISCFETKNASANSFAAKAYLRGLTRKNLVEGHL